MARRILIIGTFDTKGAESGFLKEQIGFKTEIQRQGLEPREYYAFLKEHYRGLVFTSMVLVLAGEELEKRAK